MPEPTETFLAAEARLLAAYDVVHSSRHVRLADPALDVRVLETGAGEPLVLIHGSGMSAPTWAPLLAHLAHRRVLAVDLPGFGLSDPHDYRGRTLREHAVAQLNSLLDALDLEQAALAGTSLGGMWALNLAAAAPERVRSVTVFGVPAVALPGVRADAFFRAATVPGLGRLVLRAPTPTSAKATRKAAGGALGKRAQAGLPDAYFDVIAAGMRMPGWRQAMWTHLNRAFRAGRPRPGNAFTDDELRGLGVGVRFVAGDADIYGPPAIMERAAALMPDATVEIVAGGHAPFLDEPERCAMYAAAPCPS